MALHIVFVADFGDDCIEVSDQLPNARRMSGYEDRPYPVHRAFALTRLWVDAESPPVLPEGDLTQEQYQDWRAILGEFTEEKVDHLLLAVGLAEVCVETKLDAVDLEVIGTCLKLTVTNVGRVSAGKIQIVWFGEWKPIGNEVLCGQGFHFSSYGAEPIDLQPGQSHAYVLPQPHLQKGLSYAAALPPSNYHLRVNATLPGQHAFYEIARIPGTEMGYMIDHLERFLEIEEPM
ncbi:MAG: hypothetical protein U0791_05965 [Gemmataceae bacterium]